MCPYLYAQSHAVCIFGRLIADLAALSFFLLIASRGFVHTILGGTALIPVAKITWKLNIKYYSNELFNTILFYHIVRKEGITLGIL